MPYVGFFLVFLTKRLSNCPSSTKPALPWKIWGCVPALRHFSFCKMLHLKCLTVWWIRLCIDNFFVICRDLKQCTVWDTFRILDYSELCFFRRYIHSYWVIFKVYSGFFRHSGPCVTYAYSHPCPIPNLCI